MGSDTHNDAFLGHLLAQAENMMKREGITIDRNNDETEAAVIDYAAFLFRKRGMPEGSATGMPKYLRWELNNILFSQKGQAEDGSDT